MQRTLLLLGILGLAGVALAAPVVSQVRATELPIRANALRAAGVEAAEVVEALDAARGHGLAADEAADVLEQATESTRKSGKIDNLGGYVQEKLDEGLRGRALATAIHEEHARRGTGKPEGTPGRGKAGDGDGSPGRSGDAPGHGGGPPEGKGGKEGKGKSGKGGNP